MRQAIIVDLDGTVARRSLCCPSDVKLEDKSHGHRGIHEYHRVIEDKANEGVCDIVRTYNNLMPTSENGWNTADIVFTSGRPYSCYDMTVDWLTQHKLWIGPPKNYLIMRKTGDYRRDDIVKKELYEAHIKPNYEVLFCLDDRQRVVQMWRNEGLTCLQVAPGDF